MHMYLLVQRPHGGQPVNRGIFTTLDKAKNHDPVLKGTWEAVNGVPGSWVSHRASLTYKHTIHTTPVNEELHI